MDDESRVQQLLDELFESELTPEEVCSSCPELLPEVRERWHQMSRVRDELDALFPTPRDLDGITQTLRTNGTTLPEIPGYEVQEFLGRGGMGVVFRARHLRLNRIVALKMAIAGAYAGTAERHRFQKEAEAVAALRHPNVVQIYDVGDYDGRTYFTMEFVDGGNLAEKLRGGPLPAREAASLVTTLARAIQVAHEGGIVHRDLKPANVLLTANNTPKISDFGLARRLENETGLTRTGVALGTPSYMAPEQATAQPDTAGPAVDVYALGAILYELLTARPPFRAATAAETLQQVVSQDPAPPSRLNAKVPRDLETICLKCLDKRPERRYRSATELADDLDCFNSGRPIQARRVGLAARSLRWCRRKPAAAALAVTALALVGVSLGGGIWFLQQRAERRAEATLHDAQLENEVMATITQAESLRQGYYFREARELLKQAQENMPLGHQDLHQRVNQARIDLDVVELLDKARTRAELPVEGKISSAAAEPLFFSALAKAGLGREGDDVDSLAKAVQKSEVRGEIIAGFDNWASVTPNLKRRTWLLAAARKADPNPARDRLRQPALWHDGAALTQLAKELSGVDLSPQLASALGRVTGENGGDAVALLTAAQARFPHDFWLNVALGDALYRAHRFDESLGYQRAALSLRPDVSIAYIGVGGALRSLGRLDEAISYDRQAVALEPTFAAAHSNLGGALHDKGKVDEAIDQLRQALAIDPTLAVAHVELGAALIDKGRLDESLDAFRQAARLDPSSVQAQIGLGFISKFKGRLNEAIDYFRRAVELGPTNIGASIDLAGALQAKGRLEDAIDEYQRALQLDPKLAMTHHGLGTALFQRRQFDEAIDQFQQAVALDPHLATARASLGTVLHTKGRIDEAIKQLQQALDMNPSDVAAHIDLAFALTDKGRLEEAVDQFREALRLDPKSGIGDRAFTGGMYAAARANVQIAAGKGATDKQLDDTERSKKRLQSLEWLRADLEVIKKLVKDRRTKARSITFWQTDPAFVAVRDSTELAKLPEPERKEWLRFWADVTALLSTDPVDRSQTPAATGPAHAADYR
jgi:serine/threonine-protein kinase